MSHVPMPLRSYRTWLVLHACMLPFSLFALLLTTLWAFACGTYFEFRERWLHDLWPGFSGAFLSLLPSRYREALDEHAFWETFNADET